MPVDPDNLADFAEEIRRLRDEAERALYPAYRSLLHEVYPGNFNADQEVGNPETGYPDLTVTHGPRLVNWVEVKSPGVDIDPLREPDAERFERYRQNLPHVVLTNGWHWRLFVRGELEADAEVPREWLTDDQGLTEAQQQDVMDFLQRAGALRPPQAHTYEEAVSLLASAARLIYGAVSDAGRDGLPRRLEEARASFTDLLRTNPADPEELELDTFADTLAQACTFGYLVARVEAEEPIDPDSAWRVLDTQEHPFLKSTLHSVVAPDAELEATLGGALRVAADAINAAAPTLAGPEGDWQEVPYVYEPFFAEYRPEDRFEYGVFYTQMEITRFQVQEVQRKLREELGLRGLTDPRVRYLDPACGTGTYLLALAEEALAELEGTGVPLPAALRELFFERVVGFDVAPGPASVAQARMSAWLRSHGVTQNERFPVYVVNALQPPVEGAHDITQSLWAENISSEQEAGDEIKRNQEILVVLGNPPWGDRPREAFQVGPNREDNLIVEWTRGARGAVINLYDLYVAFWRLACRLLLERPDVQPAVGIVSYITNRSWLRGKAYGGMRSWLRDQDAAAEIVDLGGDIRAGAPRNDEPVFAIQAGSAISTLTFGGETSEEDGGGVSFRRIRGRREEKLQALEERELPDADEVEGTGTDPFAPVDWGGLEEAPEISEFFAVHYPGVKTHRDDLVIDVDREDLLERLEAWNDLPDEERAERFHESRDRNVPSSTITIDPDRIIKHRYRPLDDRYLYADRRFIDQPGRVFRYYNHNPDTLALITMDSRTREGPVVIATSNLPGYDSFRGSYGCHVFPLSAVQDIPAALGPGEPLSEPAREWLEQFDAATEDLGAYILALGNAPSYAETFKEALEVESVRFPPTEDPDVFRAAVDLGHELLDAWTLNVEPLGNWHQAGTGTPLGPSTIEGDNIIFENGDRLEGIHPDTADFKISTYPVMQRFLEAREHMELRVSLAGQIRRVCAAISIILDAKTESDRLLEMAIEAPSRQFEDQV